MANIYFRFVIEVLPVPLGVPEPRPRKEDMIRVAHITDVHFDEQYAPVSDVTAL